MAAVAFDTLRCARRLKDAGYTDRQAEVQAEIMAEAFVYNMDTLVTKDYLDARFAEQEARIDGKFSEQDARIDGKFAHIDVQFTEIKGQFRLVYWMLAVVIASTVIPQVNALLSN
ncbi:MAG: DUF1640 domain-containing protein [Gammaproteobacteria bacterium]|nr:MAG: DUF1640 domain-containing protein [Gammaproteobacteria bacterium]